MAGDGDAMLESLIRGLVKSVATRIDFSFRDFIGIDVLATIDTSLNASQAEAVRSRNDAENRNCRDCDVSGD